MSGRFRGVRATALGVLLLISPPAGWFAANAGPAAEAPGLTAKPDVAPGGGAGGAAAEETTLAAASGREAGGAAPGPDAKPAAAVIPSLQPYLREVEQIRQLTFKGPVARNSQSLKDFRKFVESDLDAELPGPRAGCVSRALAQLGLLPPQFDLKKAFSDLLVTQVAAYYNPQKKTFYVVHPDLPEALLRPVLVHELTHALQDQRFGLAARVNALQKAGNDDEENAFRFLAEGEATYVMTLAAIRSTGIDPEISKQTIDWSVNLSSNLGREGIAAQLATAKEMFGPEAAAEMDSVLTYPDYLFRILFDPYFSGQRAVHHVYREGGWTAVNGLWAHPPTSTELFLHPEKLDATPRDEPVPVEVPDLTAALGPGYSTGCSNTLGELEVEILLETGLPESVAAAKPSSTPPPPAAPPTATAKPSSSPAAPGAPGPTDSNAAPAKADAGGAHAAQTEETEVVESAGAATKSETPDPRLELARSAAAGWGGDRYRAFEKDGGGTVVVWRSVWDTENDASEFEGAMRAMAAARCANEYAVDRTAGSGQGDSAAKTDVASPRARRGADPNAARPPASDLIADAWIPCRSDVSQGTTPATAGAGSATAHDSVPAGAAHRTGSPSKEPSPAAPAPAPPAAGSPFSAAPAPTPPATGSPSSAASAPTPPAAGTHASAAPQPAPPAAGSPSSTARAAVPSPASSPAPATSTAASPAAASSSSDPGPAGFLLFRRGTEVVFVAGASAAQGRGVLATLATPAPRAASPAAPAAPPAAASAPPTPPSPPPSSPRLPSDPP